MVENSPAHTSLQILSDLQQALRGESFVDAATRGIYATDASHYQITPSAVSVPMDEADVVAAIKVARKHNLPVTARGGGTSLSGQTFGPGLVLDMSKHMDQVLEVNEAEQWARVQPGVVRDRLNQQLKPMGLHFAPDPATGNRATVGGMIGNNTSGTRSIVFGKTIDHVLSCKVALADGSVIECEPMSDDQWQTKCAEGEHASLYRGVRDLVLQFQDEIRERYPKVMRRVAGYNLDEFVDGSGYTGSIGPRTEINSGRRPWSMHNLIVGSEGTLGVLLEAKIRLTPNPPATTLCVVHFDDIIASLAAVDPMLEHGPSTIELLDHTVLAEAKINPATKPYATFIEGEPKAVQIVEFIGQTQDEASAKADAFANTMRERGLGFAHVIRTDAKGQSDIWTTRKLGLGLISNVKGARKGQAFAEDACVPTAKLANYIGFMMQQCEQRGVPYSMYAHASVGVIHFRPVVDLHDPQDVTNMREIAEAGFEKVMSYGGVWSGEHGDGMLRGEFLEQQYGSMLYSAFRQLKGLFDPDNLMNPGKIVDALPMDSNLRYGQPGYQQALTQLNTHYHYRDQGGFALAVEQCNGVGACRKVGEGIMCPSYMATRNEHETTRARANILRLAMSGQLGSDPMEALASEDVHSVLELCLSCKACKSECPNSVDMAKLKSDALQAKHDKHGLPFGYRLMGDTPEAARKLAGPLASVVNAVQSTSLFKSLLEKLMGIDKRRPLPQMATKPLRSRLGAVSRNGSSTTNDVASKGTVVLFDDTYANYFEPEVGVAAIELLRDAGFETILANAKEKVGCCQRPRLSKGMVKVAKRDGAKTLANLDQLGKANPSDAHGSLPIVCLEPSCASSLKDDLPDLIDDESLGQRVAERVIMIDEFLQQQGVELTSTVGDTLFHGHCHQRSAFPDSPVAARAALNHEHQCSDSGAGCCGMAGSFGYEHYDVSKAVGEERLFPEIDKAKAESKTVVASGFSCRHQIHDFCDVQAKHWVQCVAVKK